MDTVAGPSHGFEQFDLIWIVDLSAQPADVYVHYVGGDDVVVTP
jgi:hypothetical protein